MTLAELNDASPGAFVNAVSWVFEKSPWVAERVCPLRPFDSVDSLHRAMTDAVTRADQAKQLALLCAHPDLGTRLAMSDASVQEQERAGFAALPPDRLLRLADLNARYRERFGFPFLFAVRGATPDEVLAALEARCKRTRDEEFREGLAQVFRIAHFRLHDLLTEDR
jgi:2-oxo-4-hydroxy-4-carboxy-5-ureidoimidazoline decarboxylase